VSRALRWVVISVVGVGVFALTWWLTEAFIGVDRGTAQSLAGLAVALVTLPAGWWFGLEPPTPGQGSSGNDAKQRSRKTTRVAALMTVLIILIVGGIAVLWRGPAHGLVDAANGQGSGAGKKQGMNVDQTVWYAGLKVTVKTVTFDPARQPQLTAEVVLDNQATHDFDPYYFQVSFKTGTQFIAGGIIEPNKVPALTPNVAYHMGFEVDHLDGALSAGSFVLGKGSEVQAIVPIGPGQPVANEPRTVIEPVKFALGDLVLTLSGCELRGDFVGTQNQADKGQYVLGCVFDLQYTGNGFLGFTDKNMQLLLPDGSTIGPKVPPSELLGRNDSASGVYAGFSFAWPTHGSYVLHMVNPQDDGTPSHDLSFTV
jgi:hypothetical protein